MDKTQTLKKSVAGILALSTLVWGVFASVVPSSSAAQRHTDGSVVLHNNTIWKIEGGTLRGFPSLAVFQSHGYTLSGVLTSTAGDMALPVGTNMDFADGTLVNDGGTVYMVNQGMKRGFTSASVFTGLGYSFSNLVSGSTANFTAGASVSSTTEAHPAGSLLLNSGTIWLVSGAGRSGVPSLDVFNSYGWSFGKVVTANAADLNLTVLGNVTARSNGGSLVDDGTPTPPPGSGSLSLSLASDTPASGLAVEDATRVPFTRVVLTNTSSSTVTVDTVTVQRGGVAANSSFAGVQLVDAGTNALLDVEKTLNTSNQATFTKDFTVAAGSSKTVVLAGRFGSDLSATTAERPTLGIVGVTLLGGGTVTGAPVYGNPMTINHTIDVGSATVANDSTPAANSALAVGTTGFEFSRFKITAGSEEAIVISQIKMDNMGTAGDGDITNLKLNLGDGTNLATVSQTTNKEVLFNFTPLTIAKGLNKTFSLVGDVAGGSARTVEFEIEETTDVVAMGSTFGYYLTASGVPYTSPAAHTISVGTFKVESAAGFSAANIPDGSSDVALGAFDFIVKGESMNVSRIGIAMTLTESTGSDVTYADVTNVKLVDANGVVVAGPLDLSSASTATSTDTFTVPVGTTRYTVRGTLSTDFDVNDTIVTRITPGANITAKGSVTNTSVTATPSTDVSSATQTIQAGALQVSVLSTPIAASVVKGASAHTFANIVFDASASSEDIRVTQVKTSIHTTTAAPADVNGFKIYNGSTQLSVSNDPDPSSSSASAEATSTFSLSPALVITKGTTVTLTVKGNISANAGSGTYAVGLQSDAAGTSVSATGVTTSQTITPTYNYSDGQNQTFSTAGTLTLAASASTPAAGLLAGSKTDQTVAVLSATAQNESINIEKMYFTASAVNSGGWDQVDKLSIYDGSTLVASVTPTATDSTGNTVLVNITGSPILVTAGTTKTLTIKVDTAPVNSFLGSKGAAGQGFSLSINATADVTARGVSSGSTSITKSGTPSWNQFTLFKSIPTVTKVSLSNTLTNGTNDLYKFTVSADSAGDIGLAQFAFAVATSGVTVTSFQLIEINGSTETAFNSSAVAASSGQIWSAVGDGASYAYRFYPDASLNHYRTVPAGGSRTFVLRATVSGAASTDSVSVNMLGDSAFPGAYPDHAFSDQETGVAALVAVSSGAPNQGSMTGVTGFVWSDLNYSNTTTATSTSQWTNGWRVPGLTPTSTTQTISF